MEKLAPKMLCYEALCLAENMCCSDIFCEGSLAEKDIECNHTIYIIHTPSAPYDFVSSRVIYFSEHPGNLEVGRIELGAGLIIFNDCYPRSVRNRYGY